MNKLLAVIDYQNDFVDGTLGFPKAATLDTGIAKKIQEYFAAGDHVLVTYDTHTENYMHSREGRALPVSHCISGTSGWRLYGQTQEQIGMTCCNRQLSCVCKATFGMNPADLVKLAETLGEVQEILLVGVVTNMCVISNAILLQAQWPEAQLTVDAALCASFDEALHYKALDVMESLQIKIINR